MESSWETTSGTVTLRPLKVVEVTPEYVAWLNDPLVNAFLEVRHIPQSLDSVRAFVRRSEASEDELLLRVGFAPFGAPARLLAGADTHVGNLRLHLVDRNAQSGEVGLMIGDWEYWGRGIGTAALMALDAIAIGGFQLTRLSAGCYSPNIASQRTFAAAGYRLKPQLVADDSTPRSDQFGIIRMEKTLHSSSAGREEHPRLRT